MKILSKRDVFASKTNNMSCILNIPESAELDALKDEVYQNISGLEEQDYDPHVTLIYANDVPVNKIQGAVKIIKDGIKEMQIEMSLGPVETMENAKGETVVYVNADHPKLSGMHFALRGKLKQLGAEFTYPEFKAHMTLGYKKDKLNSEEEAFLKNLKVDIPVVLTEDMANVSKKENDDWLRLARMLSR